MKISELKKGNTVEMKGFGMVKIVGTAKKYITIEQLGLGQVKAKVSFLCNEAPASDLGIKALSVEDLLNAGKMKGVEDGKG